MTRIGVQISSVREYLQTPEDVMESFRKVSEIGYRAIQIQWISPDVPVGFIKNALTETHLNCIGTQDYYDEVISNLDEIIQMNDMWGGTYICVSGIPERFHSLKGCLTFAAELNQVAKRLEERGKVLVLHPRHQEFTRFDGQIALDILLENTADNLQVELDMYHVKTAGHNPADWIYRVKGRMDLVHFKDMAVEPDGREVLMPIGQGILDWEDIIQACLQTGVQYCFAEQENWQKDPFECLKDSYKFITAHGIK